jgi:hypothetical protein
MTAAQIICGLVRWRRARGEEAEEEEGAGVKMAKLPHSPIAQDRDRGHRGSVPLPRQLLRAVATCGHDVGRRFD